MATSMRSRGAGAMNRSWTGVRPVYEDFKPMSEWKHEELADILLYHLPGFVKEQIRITAETRGILRVQGERHITDNKWCRFKEEIELPKDCNIKELRAKFERGILQITMPKMITTYDKETLEEKQTTIPEFSKTSLTKSNIPNKPQQSQEELPSNPIVPSNITPSNVRTSVDPISSIPKASNPIMPRIPKDLVDLDNSKQFQISEHQEDEHKRISTNKVKSNEIARGIQDNNLNVKKENEVHSNLLKKINTKESNRLDDLKKRITSQLARSLDEDRQLLINIGASILVILSLGAYVSYSF